VLLGNDDGTLAAHADYGAGSLPNGVAIGDLDHDGRADLAVTNNGSSSVSVLPGNGDGTFGTKTDYTTSDGPDGVAIGDLNRDGKLDLAVTAEAISKVSILLNVSSNAGVELPVLPGMFRMLAPRPVPTTGPTWVRFELHTACRVDVQLFDAAGRGVRSLDPARELAAGEHAVPWDGNDGDGLPVPDGIYFVRVRAGGDLASRKIVIAR
jgi:hypothetical protein